MLPERKSDNEEKSAVRTIFNSLKSDYGQDFMNQFSATYTQNNWMWSLYKRLYGCTVESIYSGYEKLIDSLKGERMPTTDEIVNSIRQVHKGEKEIEEISQAEGLSGFVDTLAARNPDNPVAQREIAKMREILKRPAAKTETDRSERLRHALADHESLTADHSRQGKIKRAVLHADPRCAFPGCAKPGTMSGSTTGVTNWYCGIHFSKKS